MIGLRSLRTLISPLSTASTHLTSPNRMVSSIPIPTDFVSLNPLSSADE
jgi:hypothetical protein